MALVQGPWSPVLHKGTTRAEPPITRKPLAYIHLFADLWNTP